MLFRSQIEFLLDFSGVIDARTESLPNQWDEITHKSLQNSFLKYLSWAERMFSTRGLKTVEDHRWQRALLCIGDYLLPKGRNYSFLVDSATDEASWKRLLRGPRQETNDKRKILKQLWDRLSLDRDIPDQLNQVIVSTQGIEPWRDVLVRCPEAISFCNSKYIRRDLSGNIYLLKRSQMNGYHAELFTYCLYQKLRRQNIDLGVLDFSYEEVMDSYSEPHILLSCVLRDTETTFNVSYKEGFFSLQIAKIECKVITNLCDILIDAGFSENDECLQSQSSISDIEDHLTKLDKILHKKFNTEVVHAS